jgi:putative transposase
MIPAFGFVADGKLRFNELGLFAEKSIDGINEKKQNVRIMNHVVMPNHVHILLLLKNPKEPSVANSFGPLPSGSLSALINHFKGRVTKYAKENLINWPGWQERFHEHIIRDETSFDKINQYISNNPLNWVTDKYFSK